MEKIRLKARTGNGTPSCNVLHLIFPNDIGESWLRLAGFEADLPKLAKKIKAANGKCIDIEITIKEVKK